MFTAMAGNKLVNPDKSLGSLALREGPQKSGVLTSQSVAIYYATTISV